MLPTVPSTARLAQLPDSVSGPDRARSEAGARSGLSASQGVASGNQLLRFRSFPPHSVRDADVPVIQFETLMFP